MADFGHSVKAWYVAAAASCEAAGGVVGISEVAKRAGVGRATIYRIVDGDAAEVDQATLTKLARALGVSPPVIGKQLLGDMPQDAVSSLGPVALLREARAAIEEAERMLEAAVPSTKPSLAYDVDVVKARRVAEPRPSDIDGALAAIREAAKPPAQSAKTGSRRRRASEG